MSHRWRALSPLLVTMWLLLSGCQGRHVSKSTADFPAGTGFIRQEVLVDGTPRPVWVFIPKNYRASERYPAIVFLHGLFEAGKDGESSLSAGLGPVIAESPGTWKFITIFPQSSGTWRGEERERLVIAALDSVEEHWSVDRDRVTLAGLSFGALGVWQIGARHPDRFAALVPIAAPRATELAQRLSLLPIWAFNFRSDLVVPSASADEMCQEITARGGAAKQTKFDGVGHDCWSRAVAESDLVDWMLHQRRVIARVYNSPAPTAPVADVR
ncbi:MAG: hypothetical protein H7Z14_08985 [Anaerolineae bacterium]|nr:hypothetical protein [Phycisphaerae bacterium]